MHFIFCVLTSIHFRGLDSECSCMGHLGRGRGKVLAALEQTFPQGCFSATSLVCDDTLPSPWPKAHGADPEP